ncbi:Phosphotransferase [Psidium guajava]|nr:Phosphotransferase [Psidium guajava]
MRTAAFDLCSIVAHVRCLSCCCRDIRHPEEAEKRYPHSGTGRSRDQLQHCTEVSLITTPNSRTAWRPL